ncbi:MAG: DUF924 family protein [Lysobacterales bacterium]
MNTTDAAGIVAFWSEAGYRRWFARDDAFDAQLRERFLDVHFAAARGEYAEWTDNAVGAFALVLLLDQIPRNCFRASAHAYATDGLARYHAARAIEAGFDTRVDASLRVFFYLPFEHSEDLADQRRSLELHRSLPGKDADAWALKHCEVIRRFGRFPHRNRALGRESTAEEQRYLDAGGGFAG